MISRSRGAQQAEPALHRLEADLVVGQVVGGRRRTSLQPTRSEHRVRARRGGAACGSGLSAGCVRSRGSTRAGTRGVGSKRPQLRTTRSNVSAVRSSATWDGQPSMRRMRAHRADVIAIDAVQLHPPGVRGARGARPAVQGSGLPSAAEASPGRAGEAEARHQDSRPERDAQIAGGHRGRRRPSAGCRVAASTRRAGLAATDRPRRGRGAARDSCTASVRRREAEAVLGPADRPS